MHMPAGWLIKHQMMQRCDKNNQMRRRRMDVAIASQCTEASFSLTGEDEAECIEGVENFKHLGRMLDRTDDDWPAVGRNIRKACQVWSCLEKMLRREGADP